MLRERSKVQNLLSHLRIQIEWAKVEERLEEEDLIRYLKGKSAIICGDDRFSEKVYQACPDLKAVIKWGTGIDSLCAEVAEKYGVSVRRTPGAFTDPVADSALAYMLTYARKVRENDLVLKSRQWFKPQATMLKEHTVGIIGHGAIGSAVSARLRPFGCKILATDIDSEKVKGSSFVEFVSLEQVLSQASIISIHCDLNQSSQQLLDSSAFSQMTQQPFIINTARGPIISESALIDALQTKKIVGAALDVYEQEPLATSSPLRGMSEVFLAAHNSNSSQTCWMNVHQNSVHMLCEELNLESIEYDGHRSHESTQ